MNVGDTEQLPTVLSFCTGYGGIERGLDLAGVEHRVLAYVEIEAFAIANLVNKMESDQLAPAPIYTDLKTFPAGLFRDAVDIITGGYPCQPFSHAGKRQGSEDPRHLWPYISEAVGIIRPGRVFFENVEGHISLGLNEVVSDLEDRGYDTTWGIFSAAEVGAPHQRKRVYILGDATNAGSPNWAGEPLGQLEAESQPKRPDSEVAHSISAGLERHAGDVTDTGLSDGPDTETDPQHSDAYSVGPHRAEMHERGGEQRRAKLRDEQVSEPQSVCAEVAHSISARSAVGLPGPERPEQEGLAGEPHDCSGQSGRRAQAMQWAPEPDVGMLADGLAAWLGFAEPDRGAVDVDARWVQVPCEKDAETVLRELWYYAQTLRASQGSQPSEQPPLEYPDAVQFLSHLLTPPGGGPSDEIAAEAVSALRENCVSAGVVLDAFDPVQKVRTPDAHPQTGWVIMATLFGAEWRRTAVPRVSVAAPDRVDRIRLLGNGVVPQTACRAWQVLDAELKWRYTKE